MLPPGLMLAACLEREDPRDAFISRKAKRLRDLPQGAVLGTASLRRQAMAKRLRPDLAVVPLRGNVETRLRKLDAGEADATLLALAGLKRLGLDAARDRDPRASTNFCRRSGRAPSASRRAPTMRARAMLLARINHADTFDGARLRARVPRRARRLVQDADRRPRRPSQATRSNFRGLIARPDGKAAHDIAGNGRVHGRRSASAPMRRAN